MMRTNQEGKPVAIVTGANGVIGKAIVAGIAEYGFEVVMVCRDEKRAERALDEVRRARGRSDVRVELADLSRRESVFALAARWQGRLDVLVNNAAIAPRSRTETPEGIELQFATNVLGYVWMMRAFEAALRRSAPARVVNVASYWAGDLDLSDLQFHKRAYDNDQAYRQSKQANRMLTVAFAQEWRDVGITVTSCHPGDANTVAALAALPAPRICVSTSALVESLAAPSAREGARARPARLLLAARRSLRPARATLVAVAAAV